MLEKLSGLKEKKIAVLGDFLLDTYTKGSVKRISPEAPVCVLKVKKQEHLPGGAGNVALNCKALGSSVTVIGRVGDDFASNYLKNSLENMGINTDGLLNEEGYQIPVKNRFMAEYQQLLRVDFEDDQPITNHTEEKIVRFLEVYGTDFDLFVVSDYNKGFLTRSLLKAIFSFARRYKIPVFVDPKGSDFSKYQGATLIKPNLQEAYLASGLDDKSSLEEVAIKLSNISLVENLLITRSEKGMSLFKKEQRQDFRACAKEVIDVTGAGDTVLATLAVAYASGLDIETSIELSNIAASCAIEKMGCVQVGKKELLKAMAKGQNLLKNLMGYSDDFISMWLEGEKILIYPLDAELVNLAFFNELFDCKKKNPEALLAVMVNEDCSESLLNTLEQIAAIDLIISESKQELLKDLALV
jgi:D-beta-D-heptose 7-phosphate kinase/D-beta-D-heptose 1-phosphate adenosyltransferase